MRVSKFFFIFLVLLFCLASSDDYYQQDTGATGDGDVCAGYELCQNFEGTGYDNSESWSGTSDPDYTTMVLLGSQSNHATAGETLNSPVFTASDEFWFFARIQVNNGNQTTKLFFTDSVSTDAVYLQINDTETVALYSGVVNAGGGTLTADTAYAIWGHIKKGTGQGNNDGEAYIYVDTVSNACVAGTCARPTLTGSTTAGRYDGEPDIDRTTLDITAASTNVLLLDDFRVSLTEINNVSY